MKQASLLFVPPPVVHGVLIGVLLWFLGMVSDEKWARQRKEQAVRTQVGSKDWPVAGLSA